MLQIGRLMLRLIDFPRVIHLDFSLPHLDLIPPSKRNGQKGKGK